MTKVSEKTRKGSELQPGIRGWLLVFLLWLGVINPVFWIGFNFVAFNRMEEVNPSDAELMRAMGWDVLLWVITLVREGMRMAAALILYFHRQSVSVWIALAVLWLAGPFMILGPWAVLDSSEYNMAALVRSALCALGWSLFLFMSQRVRRTYRFRTQG